MNKTTNNYTIENIKNIIYIIAPIISNVRKMENAGQVMGLSATIDTTTLLDSTTPNNVDVHMVKPYEWTAVAILGRSSYGIGLGMLNNAPMSTTGNNYQVKIMKFSYYSM